MTHNPKQTRNPKQWMAWIRRGTLVVSLLGLLWIVSRFRTYGLEGDPGVLPMRYEPGQTLLIDMRPRPAEIGDAWFVRTPDGTLALGVVQALEEERMAMLFGRVPFDPAHWTWVPKGDGQARVLMVLPF